MVSSNRLLILLITLCLSLILVSIVLVFNSPPDFKTYAMSSSLPLSVALKTFNFIELGSLLIISIIPKIFDFNSEVYLVSLSLFVLMYLVSSVNSFYSKISLIFLLAGFYGANLLLSQYKMLLALFFTVFIYEYSKKTQKYKVLPLTLFLLHSQAVLYSIAHYLSFKQCLVYSFIIAVFISQIIFVANIYLSDVYLVSKISTYTLTNGDALSNFTLIRIIIFSFITLFLIDNKENYYFKCYIICVIISLFSLSFPVIAGRIASMAIVLEPFIVDKYKNKVYRKVFLCFCILITVVRYV